MARYAESTTVDPSRSRAEIEDTLRRYGADSFISGWEVNKAMIGFRCRQRFVRFIVSLPAVEDKRFSGRKVRGSWKVNTPQQRQAVWEQEIRQRWRALCLVIKAKLESVESGIEEFDSAFMAQIVLPDGSTVAETLMPQIADAYRTGQMPQLLPALPAPPKDPQTPTNPS